MVNRGAVSQALGVNGTYTLPEGYHNGSGKVTQNIPIQGAEVPGTDRAWATNVSCWEGVACLGVRNAHYLNGVNWIQGNIPNFYAGNIKKGVNMGGVVGTFEGYVPTATDLYLRGNNIRGLHSGTVSFDTGQITLGANRTSIIYIDNLNFTGYNWLNIQGYANNAAGITKTLRLYQMPSSTSSNLLGYLDVSGYAAGQYTYGFDLSHNQVGGLYMRLEFYQMDGAIYRIWLT